MAICIPFTRIEIMGVLLDLIPFVRANPIVVAPRTLPDDLPEFGGGELSFKKSPTPVFQLPALTLFEELIIDPDAATKRDEAKKTAERDRLVQEENAARIIREATSSEDQRRENQLLRRDLWRDQMSRFGIDEATAKLRYFNKGLCPCCGAKTQPVLWNKAEGQNCSNCNASMMVIESLHGRQIYIMRDNQETERATQNLNTTSNREKFADNVCTQCGDNLEWVGKSYDTKRCRNCSRTIRASYRGDKHFSLKVIDTGYPPPKATLESVVERRLKLAHQNEYDDLF